MICPITRLHLCPSEACLVGVLYIATWGNFYQNMEAPRGEVTSCPKVVELSYELRFLDSKVRGWYSSMWAF